MDRVLRFPKWAARSERRISKSRRSTLGLSPYHRRLVVEPLEERRLLSLSTTIVDLGPVIAGYAGAGAAGINDSGQVVWNSGVHAFLYSNGASTQLGTFGGPASEATDINDSGQVVGWADTTSTEAGYYIEHAFLYSNGTMTDLDPLLGGGGSIAYGINDSGQVVGVAGTGNGTYYDFLYSNGTMTDLGPFFGVWTGWPCRINDSGQVAVCYNGNDHAALYSNGAMTDLGTLPVPGIWGSGYSQASGINNSGQVIGYASYALRHGYPPYWYESVDHAFLYTNGTMTDLGTLPGRTKSYADGINDSGQVVGFCMNSTGGPGGAFLYDGRQMIDLNGLLPANSGWRLAGASAINNQGQIVGWGSYNGRGNNQEFLLNVGAWWLTTKLSVPNSLRPDQASTLTLQYTNTSTTAMPAPLLVLTATQNGNSGALLTLDPSLQGQSLDTATTPPGYSQTLQVLASGATPGILEPGESETVSVYYAGWLSSQWDSSAGQPIFSVGVATAEDATAIDWAGIQSSLQSDGISAAAWNAIYPNLAAQLGSTYGTYVQKLDADAQYLAGIGENVTDGSQLFGFEVGQASGYSPLGSLASATDAQVATPGLSLSFTRTFAPGIIQQNQFGLFGWGWTDSWDTYLVVDPDGTVTVFGPGGTQRQFVPGSSGGYLAQPGDHGTLVALAGGGYTLTELDGQATAYNLDGSLNYVQDADGNRITAGYSGSLLMSLTHSSGQSLALTYNAAGLVSTITDSAGRTTTYNYDPTNQYLTSVVDFDGRTTSYTYNTGSNPTTAHALLSVRDPDGSHDYFSYDAEGRLANAHRDFGAENTTFSYDEGQVSVSDALGDTTSYYFDNRGLLLQVQNPLQNTISHAYDSDLNLVSTTDAEGQVYTNTYDSSGNLLSSTDPLSHTVSYTYSSMDDRLASVTDGNGNTTSYGYDGKGDLTSTTYADGTIESVAYDPWATC